MAFKFNPENELFINSAQNTSKHIFLTGDAGTGKSTTLKYFIDNSNGKNILLLGSTGTAAINIGGMTIHKFFGLNHEFSISKIKPLKEEQIEILKHIDTIVIDEASMIRVDLFDLMDQMLKRSLLSDEPFGGKQLILIGDLFQLPPVVTYQDQEFLKDLYEGYYFFNSNVWQEIKDSLIYVNLVTIYRQSDTIFSGILNRIREGSHTEDDLKMINKNIINDITTLKDNPLYITTTNKVVKDINEKSLMKINKQSHVFNAIIQGEFNENLFPNLKTLILKEGANVMFVKNNKDLKWSNGTLGTIEKILPGGIVLVKLHGNGKTEIVNFEEWVISEPYFNEKKNEIQYTKKGVFKQLPITLSYGVTIHKSQGKTFDSGYIDLGNGTFAFGQAYVALSRIKDLNKLYLKRPITNKDIKTDQKIVTFMKNLLINNTK